MARQTTWLVVAVFVLTATQQCQAQINWASVLSALTRGWGGTLGSFNFGSTGGGSTGSSGTATWTKQPTGSIAYNAAAGQSSYTAKYLGNNVMETPETSVQYSPITTYKAQVVVHKKGYCIPRMSANLVDAYPSDCPAGTYMTQSPSDGRQVCTRSTCQGSWSGSSSGGYASANTIGSTKLGTAANGAGFVKGSGSSTGVVTCNSVYVKPNLKCNDDCITDFKTYGDKCLCQNGWLGCPMNYQTCNCNLNGIGFPICVADSYWCNWYCNYQDIWGQYTSSKGANLCPLDLNQLSPYYPPSLYPRLLGLAQAGRRRSRL